MKQKIVRESINEILDKRTFVIFKHVGGTKEKAFDPIKLEKKENKYPEIFDRPNIQLILDYLKSSKGATYMMGPKVDIHLLHRFMKYSGSEDSLKQDIMLVAPVLGFTRQLKLSDAEMKELSFKQGMQLLNIEPGFFKQNEIGAMNDTFDLSELLPNDIVVRTNDGSTQPMAYRFDRKLTEKELNYLKGTYAGDYGNSENIWWDNYLAARPIMVKNIRDDEHLWKTKTEDFDDIVYK